MSAEKPEPSSGTALRLGALLAVAVGLLVARQLGLFESFASPSAMKQVLLERGAWGYVVFIGAYAILQPFGVPGTVFILAAPLVWPWPVAFALSMAGTMAASVIGFSFARFVARDWFEQRIPARFQAYNATLAARGFVTVATLRFLFWMPQILHAFFGVSRVGFWTHFWGSIVGYAVPLLLTAYFGERLFGILSDLSANQWLGLLGATLGIGLGSWLWNRRHKRRAA